MCRGCNWEIRVINKLTIRLYYVCMITWYAYLLWYAYTIYSMNAYIYIYIYMKSYITAISQCAIYMLHFLVSWVSEVSVFSIENIKARIHNIVTYIKFLRLTGWQGSHSGEEIAIPCTSAWLIADKAAVVGVKETCLAKTTRDPVMSFSVSGAARRATRIWRLEGWLLLRRAKIHFSE